MILSLKKGGLGRQDIPKLVYLVAEFIKRAPIGGDFTVKVVFLFQPKTKILI